MSKTSAHTHSGEANSTNSRMYLLGNTPPGRHPQKLMPNTTTSGEVKITTPADPEKLANYLATKRPYRRYDRWK